MPRKEVLAPKRYGYSIVTITAVHHAWTEKYTNTDERLFAISFSDSGHSFALSVTPLRPVVQQ